jgi:membrane protease YdiL (CAAX protease family)
VPVYLAMEAAFRAVHFLVPQTEPTPEILRRMLLMPADVILFNFVIVAALEEWVFRKGVFKPMVEKIKKWGAPSKWWFWPAAIASALIFSGAHYVDWGAMLAHLGIGSGNAALGSSLAGAYAFTWASFAARAVGGVLLAWLYASSGSLLLPMIAHFGSNTLEALGMRFGLWPFLCTIAVVLAAQKLRAAKVPEAK